MSFLKKTAACAVSVTMLLGFSASSVANADTGPIGDIAVVVGSGTITPGLATGGCAPQEVTFTGTLTVVDGDDTGGSVVFNGSDNCGNVQSGFGSGTLSGVVSGTASFSRTGVVVNFGDNGGVVINGKRRSILVWDCVWVYTNVGPVTAYESQCVVVLA